MNRCGAGGGGRGSFVCGVWQRFVHETAISGLDSIGRCLPPQSFKANGGRARVAHGMHNVSMAEIILHQPGIVAAIGEIVARGMAEHMGMDMKAEFGALANSRGEIIYGLPREGTALAEEEIGGPRIRTQVSFSEPCPERTVHRLPPVDAWKDSPSYAGHTAVQSPDPSLGGGDPQLLIPADRVGRSLTSTDNPARHAVPAAASRKRRISASVRKSFPRRSTACLVRDLGIVRMTLYTTAVGKASEYSLRS